jgi:sortase A
MEKDTPKKEHSNNKHPRKRAKKQSKGRKKRFAAMIAVPTTLLIVLLTGSVFALLFPDTTLVFLKNNLPQVFDFFIESEEPELDRSQWTAVNEDDWVPPEEQNSGEVKTNYEEQKTILEIPSADIRIPVVEGETEDAMYRGAWHFPKSPPLNSGGNTVIFAHRFYKVPPEKDTFYSLDKVRVGDAVTITNKEGDVYKYQVIESKIVAKNDRSILENSNSEILTLVTCTPLWTSDKRLVVIAKKL